MGKLMLSAGSKILGMRYVPWQLDEERRLERRGCQTGRPRGRQRLRSLSVYQLDVFMIDWFTALNIHKQQEEIN